MCWNKSLFQNLTEQDCGIKVRIGDGSVLNVKGVRTVTLNAFNGQEYIKRVLSHVLYVPDLKFNLFSVGCAVDKVYSMVSNSEKCEFRDKNETVRAIAVRQNKLYKMEFVPLKNSELSKSEIEDNTNVLNCYSIETVDKLSV